MFRRSCGHWTRCRPTNSVRATGNAARKRSPSEENSMEESSMIARDLRLNLKRVLEEGALDAQDRYFALLATSVASQHGELAGLARRELAARGARPEEIQEATESAAIMAMLNTYYRFRHMVENDEDYRVASLRMTVFARPVLGKMR